MCTLATVADLACGAFENYIWNTRFSIEQFTTQRKNTRLQNVSGNEPGTHCIVEGCLLFLLNFEYWHLSVLFSPCPAPHRVALDSTVQLLRPQPLLT